MPIVVTLQGEDLFLDGLPEPFRQQALDLIRAEVANVDLFVAVSEYYADFMRDYLDIPHTRCGWCRWGSRLREGPPAPLARAPFTIGYFARIAPEKGLHNLAEAYRILRHERGLPPSRLRAAGFCGPDQQGYLDGVRRGLRVAGLDSEFEYAGSPDRQGKYAFLRELDVFSVPSPYHEPKGLYLLEAMAAGCRSCAHSRRVAGGRPRHRRRSACGLGRAGGHRRRDCSSCGATQRAADLGRRGRASVSSDFTVTHMAERVEAVYREAVS